MDNEGYSRDGFEAAERNPKNAAVKLSSEGESAPYSHYTRRATLAQCFATFVDGLSFTSLGFLLVTPAVVIANVRNVKNGLSLNDQQVSWYASFLPICMPIGCLLGGFLQNYIGRRHGLLLMNISTIMTWIILYNAMNVGMLYASSIMAGVSLGFIEAPGITYVSEIATASIRGTLLQWHTANISLGGTLAFFLSSFVSWRTSCLIYIGWSIFSALMLIFIPDSPLWLISKKKPNEALKALQWLRGWVDERDVMSEFKELNQYVYKSATKSLDPPLSSTKIFKMSYLMEKRTLRPYILLICFSFIAFGASLNGAHSYFILICDSLNLPIKSTWLNFMKNLASLAGNVAGATTIKMLGKRGQFMTGVAICAVLGILLALYMIFQHELGQPWIFIVLFITLGFAGTIVLKMPWVHMGEVYPVKTRSVATGITGASFYLVDFIYIKTFYYLDRLITTPGTFIFYAFLAIIGFFFLWVFMPETEGKTLAEVEELFEDNARKTCRHYRKKKK